MIDADKDGLSDPLEAEIGTSPTNHDTDGDGLFDYYEVIGRAIDTPDGPSEQGLVRLGASPLRRDLFIEFNQRLFVNSDGDVQQPPTWGEMLTMEPIFLDLPEVTNPDGSVGIRVHADIGSPCRCVGPCLFPPPVPRPDLCGDFGGLDRIANPAFDGFPKTKSGRQAAMRDLFEPVRIGLFHYVWLEAGDTGAPGTGALGVAFLRVKQDGAGGSFPEVLAHELGHNLGLRHWGADVADPATIMNGKAAYPSIMNYSFSRSLNAGPPRFSRGQVPTLNHNALSEVLDSGVDLSYLQYAPFEYLVAGNRIDWNRDGKFDHVGAVRFDYTERQHIRAGGDGHPAGMGVRPLNPGVPSGGGALVSVASGDGQTPDTVWAFFPFSFLGQTRLAYASLPEAAEECCAEFSDWTALPGGGDGATPDPDGEVAAARIRMPVDGVERTMILVVFPRLDGVLYYTVFDPESPEATPPFQPIPGWPAGTAARQATLASFFSDTEVFLVYRDRNSEDLNRVYRTAFTSAGTWLLETKLVTTTTTPGAPETPVASYLTPGVVQYGSQVYLAAVDPDPDGTETRPVRIYSNIGVADSGWDLETNATAVRSSITDDPISEEERTRLSLLALPHIRADGSEVGTAYLAVFYSLVDKKKWARMYMGGSIAPGRAPDFRPQTRWIANVENTFIRDIWPAHSLAITQRGAHGVAAYTREEGDAPAAPIYVPYANALPPADIMVGINDDTDDGAVIADTQCRTLWLAAEGCAGRCVDPTVVCSPLPDEGVLIECTNLLD
jgi:hypothetical protein